MFDASKTPPDMFHGSHKGQYLDVAMASQLWFEARWDISGFMK